MSGYVSTYLVTAGTYFYLILVLDIPGRYIPKVLLSLPTVPGAACWHQGCCYAVSGHAPFEFRSKYYFK